MKQVNDNDGRRGRRCDRRGVALVLVLLLVAVATVLALSAVTTSTVRRTTVESLRSAARARYIAECGLQHGLWLLRSDPEAMPETEDAALGWYHADETDDAYKFYAVDDGGSRYTIHAIGRCGELRRRANMTVKFTSPWYGVVTDVAPAMHWKLGDLGATAVDSAGGGDGVYHVSGKGRPPAIAHAGDGAIELDGWDDYVDLGEIEVAGDEVTFFGWFKADDWDCTDAPLIAKATGTAKNDHAWMLGTDQESGDVRLRFQLRADGVTRELVADGGNCEAGEWVFAAAVYDGERMRLYKDGVEVGSRRHSGTIGDAGGQWEEDGEGEEDGADALSEASAWIGGNPSGARQRPWDGCIDEVAICDRALTPQEIRALWRARLAEAEIIAYGDE